MIRLVDILKDLLEEKKADRCLRIARQKYDKPSAYRSGAIVRCRRGEIWKDIKEDESLHKWFSRKGGTGKSKGWVDCNTCRDGKCKSCGRQKGEKRAKYPSCRPTPAQCKSPGKGKTFTKWANSIKGKTLEEIYGKEKADQIKLKKSLSVKGYKHSSESKLKMSESRKGLAKPSRQGRKKVYDSKKNMLKFMKVSEIEELKLTGKIIEKEFNISKFQKASYVFNLNIRYSYLLI